MSRYICLSCKEISDLPGECCGAMMEEYNDEDEEMYDESLIGSDLELEPEEIMDEGVLLMQNEKAWNEFQEWN